MGEGTKIGWCDHSFNPWLGCSKVSPGCDNCYARAWGKRFGVEWGLGKPRRRTSEANWRKPLQWDRKAAKLGIRYRVFCASLADVFDPEVPGEWRHDVWALIRKTPHLDWLLLSKRPENWSEAGFLGNAGAPMTPVQNVRLGVTVENQEAATRRLPLLAVYGIFWKTFISYEPALGPVDWWPWLDPNGAAAAKDQWLIVGCESGPHARPMKEEWARSLRDQCQAAAVPFFYKQAMVNGRLDHAPRLDGKLYQEFPR